MNLHTIIHSNKVFLAYDVLLKIPKIANFVVDAIYGEGNYNNPKGTIRKIRNQ